MSSSVKNIGGDGNGASFDLIQNRIESLSGKMDKLINIQEKVLNRLDGMSQDIDVIEMDMENLKVEKEEIHMPPKMGNQTQFVGQEVREICQEMSTIMLVVNQRSEQQTQKLEGMEKLVLSMQQVISFIGETVKNSRVMELIYHGAAARKGSKPKDSKGKQGVKRKSSTDTINKKFDKLKDHTAKDGTLSPKGLKAQKKTKTPDTAENISLKKQVLLLEGVQKLNRENAENSGHQLIPGNLDLEAGVFPKDQQPDTAAGKSLDYLREDTQAAVDEKHKVVKELPKKVGKSILLPAAREDKKEPTAKSSNDLKSKISKFCVTEQRVVVKEHTKSKVVVVEEKKEKEEEEKKAGDPEEGEQKLASEGWAVFMADGVQFQLNLKQRVERERKEKDAKKDAEEEDEEEDEDDKPERYFIDTSPPPSAPFSHRIVSIKPNQIINFYNVNWQEVLGGGRFGQVHKCVENSSGITLAVKVIKAKSLKEKVTSSILMMIYVGGGELFDRIIDENYTLMELDAVLFIKQICEGLQHMHKMYILHLDLKPENILCVSRITNKVKIIDFGLARIYKPREKLRVNFGTPEFLAPEVINYDFVSFNTDMWSLGVITYMLLSGLCPFLGDDDNETLNNILACKWNFEENEFVDTTEEAKDFISKLLIVNKR
ncbi:Myosin light chain kinase family member 4 [Liparis tanakae]|uniref:Myosin light chain kinase family member 4 n=1 Tax=Liparis tanakae TaxID=230148 RepID=A0A4Z2GLA8_9TELE|nr:Myosin light chain kinase family member 4 [Liparis tanakae]